MKERYVSDLAVGQAIQETFFVRKKLIKQTKRGDDYLDLLLADRTGEIEAKIWSSSNAISVQFERGDFVEISARVEAFGDKVQLVIDNLRKLDFSEVDKGDFIPVCPRDIEEMLARLKEIAYGISNPHLKSLIEAFFNDATLLERFKNAPGAKEFHHAYIGGLLEHTLSVVGLVELVCKHYTDVDRDMLVAAAIFHDIGKVEEISQKNVEFDYTVRGRFLGHVVLSLEILNGLLARVEKFPELLALEFLHVVASHHGELEFGAPKEPMTKEALILHYLDNMDAKMWMMGHAVPEAKDDLWAYSKSLRRVVYRGGKEGYRFNIPDAPVQKEEMTKENDKFKEQAESRAEKEESLTTVDHPFLTLFDKPDKK